MKLMRLVPLLLVVCPFHASAQVPQIITYQGRVTSSGTNYNGTGLFQFALVNGAGSQSFWSNDGSSTNGSQSVTSVPVAVSNGFYTVLLGDTNMTPISPSVFNNPDVRLRLWFSDGTHGSHQLTPDQRVTAVGYAMVAASVPDGAITSSKLAGGAVTSANLAPGAVAAGLQADGQTGVASGGIVLSTSSSASSLLNAGYTMIGKSAVGEHWEPHTVAGPPKGRSGHTAVWTGTKMIVWGGVNTNYLNDGALYDPAANTWTALPSVPWLEPRQYHTAVWTGSQMIIWGGYDNGTYLNDGGRYDPKANVWSSVTTAGAPVLRDAQVAVWTGSEMIIWGGYNANGSHNLGDGARYNPVTDSWTPMSANNAPSPRYFHTAVWTGSEMIVWGGSNGSYLGDGARYNPSNDTWTRISNVNAPVARYLHVAVWSGSEMIIWGGYGTNTYLNDGARYNPTTDSWTRMSTNNPPVGRYGHTGVWSGAELLVWGGYDFGYLQDGGHYDPVADVWQTMTGVSGPSARDYHSAVWTGSQMIIFGGIYNSTYYNDISSYSPPMTLYLYQRP